MTARWEVHPAAEIAPVGAGAIDRRQKLVAEVAVTGLDVHEVETCRVGEAGPVDELIDQLVEFVVGQHRVVAGLHPGVQKRMAVERAGAPGPLPSGGRSGPNG